MENKVFSKAILVVGAILLSGQIFYNTKVGTMLENVESITEERETIDYNLSLLEPFIDNPNLLDEKIVRANERLREIENLLPSEDKSSKHIDILSEVASRNKLKAYHLQFERPELIEYGHQALNISVALEGKQTDLLRAIDDLQSFEKHAYVIKHLDMQPTNDSDSMLKLTMTTYYREDTPSEQNVEN